MLKIVGTGELSTFMRVRIFDLSICSENSTEKTSENYIFDFDSIVHNHVVIIPITNIVVHVHCVRAISCGYLDIRIHISALVPLMSHCLTNPVLTK